MLAALAIDIEPIFFGLHGFFHTFLGGIVGATALSGVLWLLRRPVNLVMAVAGVPYPATFRSVWTGALFGFWIPVLLDSVVYSHLKPLFPFTFNPFYCAGSYPVVAFFCEVCAALAVFLLFIRLVRQKMRH